MFYKLTGVYFFPDIAFRKENDIKIAQKWGRIPPPPFIYNEIIFPFSWVKIDMLNKIFSKLRVR